jgi:hypothetical protein
MNICYRRILEVKVLAPSKWSRIFGIMKNDRWKVSVKYFDPHNETRWTYHRYVYIPVEEEVYKVESEEMIECRTEESAKRMKEEIESRCGRCDKFYCFMEQ